MKPRFVIGIVRILSPVAVKIAFIAMGIDEDLTAAKQIAVREAIDFLVTEKKLSHEDAYMLASVGVGFAITQLADGKKGVHAMIPKAIFRAGAKR